MNVFRTVLSLALFLSAPMFLVSGCSDNSETVAVESRRILSELQVLDEYQQPATVFVQGEEITFSLVIKNSGDELQILEFPTAQKYDFQLYDANDLKVWQWSTDTGQIFSQALTRLSLEPQSEQQFQVVWDQQLLAGGYPAMGEYVLQASIPGQDLGVSISLTIQ